MKDYVEFNINTEVRVKLTAYGKAAYSAYFAGWGLNPLPLNTDADGWSTFQMWRLMELFGRDLHMGGDLPFETTIRIPSQGGAGGRENP